MDRTDIAAILQARGTDAGFADSRDLDGDLLVTVNDARICVLLCKNPLCAPDEITTVDEAMRDP